MGYDGLKTFSPEVEGEESDGLPIVLNDQDWSQGRIIHWHATFPREFAGHSESSSPDRYAS
jgi:hypothetical protein